MMKKFKHWFVNVYWYHYKLHTLGGLFGALILGIMIYSGVTRVTPDVFLTLASAEPVAFTQSDMITDYLAEKDGGEMVFASNALQLSEASDPAMASWEQLHIALIDEERTLFIVGESMREFFSDLTDSFMSAEEMELPADAENPCMVPLTGAPILADVGLVEEAVFGLVKRPPENPEDAERFENAIQCLRWVLEG